MSNYANWARRQSSRGSVPSVPPGVPIASNGVAPASIPQAPPGYAWCMHPTAGMVLVPLDGGGYQVPQSPAPMPRAVLSRPGFSPPTAPVETCLLVHPGNRDTYAEMLATLPDLVPPTGYDAMKGNPDPRVVAECQSAVELMGGSDGAVHPESGLRARGGSVSADVVSQRVRAATDPEKN